jgi:hypothetical protein
MGKLRHPVPGRVLDLVERYPTAVIQNIVKLSNPFQRYYAAQLPRNRNRRPRTRGKS